MDIRGHLTHTVMGWESRTDRPLDDEDILLPGDRKVALNPDLFSPVNAEQLLVIREHCLESPQGILLDIYQAVTELELRHAPGSVEGKARYINGLREEVGELAKELKAAQLEHPYHAIGRLTEDTEDAWLTTVLDHNRLRFNDVNMDRKGKCLGEMGDILWYSSRLAAEAGINLSQAFTAFLRHSDAGNLRDLYVSGHEDEVENRAKAILDFRLVQDIALSQKLAYTEQISEGTSQRRTATIDNAPYILLNRIIDDELTPLLTGEINIPRLQITIGKLIWFVAYTSNSLLNADFAVIMQANLEKITARSQRGTIFSKTDRSEADEAHVAREVNPRGPLSLRHLS